MVNTRMEGKVETLERDITDVRLDVNLMRGDLTTIKDYMGEVKDWMQSTQETLTGLMKQARAKSPIGSVTEVEASIGQVPVAKEEKPSFDLPKYGYPTWPREGGREVYPKKLELPVFTGDDPLGWTFRADRYFQMNNIDEEDRMSAAATCMEGRALTWYQWVEARSPLKGWEEFKRALLSRFRPTQGGTAFEELVGVQQWSSVSEYREVFEQLSAPLRNVSDDLLMGVFINGLKEEIKAEVRLLGPQGLIHVMGLAQKVEDKNKMLRRAQMGKAQLTNSGAGSGAKGISMAQTHGLVIHSNRPENFTRPEGGSRMISITEPHRGTSSYRNAERNPNRREETSYDGI